MSLASLIGHAHSYLILRRGQRTRTQQARREGLGNVLLTHIHTRAHTLRHTHARFISSGNLAPIVETQPSSGYHRNRSNGSLLFVRVASLLPPSPVTTQPPQRPSSGVEAPFKNRLMLMINPSAKLQIKQMTVLQLTLAQAALEGEQ